MERKPVQSSSIASVGYDADSRELHIEFTSGKTYSYPGVAPDEHEALMGAPSLGAHFSKHIRPSFSGKLLK